MRYIIMIFFIILHFSVSVVNAAPCITALECYEKALNLYMQAQEHIKLTEVRYDEKIANLK